MDVQSFISNLICPRWEELPQSRIFTLIFFARFKKYLWHRFYICSSAWIQCIVSGRAAFVRLFFVKLWEIRKIHEIEYVPTPICGLSVGWKIGRSVGKSVGQSLTEGPSVSRSIDRSVRSSGRSISWPVSRDYGRIPATREWRGIFVGYGLGTSAGASPTDHLIPWSVWLSLLCLLHCCSSVEKWIFSRRVGLYRS